MESANVLGASVFAIVIIFIYIIVIRQVFGISKFQTKQDAIMKLLAEIALKNGVEPDKVDGI